MVRRESGAVTVLATEPATPPLKRCLRAETPRESVSWSLGSGSLSMSAISWPACFVSLRIIVGCFGSFVT